VKDAILQWSPVDNVSKWRPSWSLIWNRSILIFWGRRSVYLPWILLVCIAEDVNGGVQNCRWLQPAYDKPRSKKAFFDPSRSQDFLFISGTKVFFRILLETTFFSYQKSSSYNTSKYKISKRSFTSWWITIAEKEKKCGIWTLLFIF